ncbi:MAG: carboxypeptidase-like regulatory domain-containing protein [Terracidiphilus sp.]
MKLPAATVLLWLGLLATAGAAEGAQLAGRVSDAAGEPVAQATVQLSPGSGLVGSVIEATSDAAGKFLLTAAPGRYELSVEAPRYQRLIELLSITTSSTNLDIRLLPVVTESVTVTADINQGDVLSPDPAVKVFATENLLDANPGRPGAPISIPGYPIETASSGIKAPQYFAPGVAGDHGEPIAQYIQVGTYLVPNNLSANAHGNGYSDPNIYIAGVIESVEVDGGAYNVREGNHALNLAATYGLRTHLAPFVTFNGDYRDLTATAGMSPGENSWLAAEGSYGNGFLDRLEHRRQFKFNGGRVYHIGGHAGGHTITLFGIAYLGYGYVAGLRPIYGFNAVDAAAGWVEYPDTIDPRQKDQTHTALAVLNDDWKLGSNTDLQLSGFFRTYNLSLFSDFGLGLIRQSEFRTVGGASADYVKNISPKLTLLAGTDYEREAPRRDDLDHYNFYNPATPGWYGPFEKIDGNNVTISPVTPYVAAQGLLGSHLDYYAGWRRDEIFIDNQDLVTPANSWSKLVGLNSPKATLTFVPRALRVVPLVSLSFGKSFFTEDPREGTALDGPTAVDPVETARSYQLVASKTFNKTDVKMTLGHETQTAEYGKIDPDQGLQFDLGPGRIRFLAATLRQGFAHGSLLATFEQADARLIQNSFSVVPEAPRLIGDLTGTYDRLPFHMQAKGEFEYVGRKVVGQGCSEASYLSGDPNALNYYCLGVPNKEFRFAAARPFMDGRMNLGVNTMIASGWTGQTTEDFGAAGVYGPGLVGLGSNGLVPANPVNEVVGVRIPSYASLNLTWRFGGEGGR